MTRTRSSSWALAAVFLIAILLRFPLLGTKSLWFDEAFSVHSATSSLKVVDANAPPLYYMLLYATMQLIGQSEAAVRLPSAVFSLLSIGLLYLLGRKLLDRDTALLAAALLALSPLDVWYGREARMYAATGFVTLLMALGLAWRHWVGFVLFFFALITGLYLSYLALPIWLALSAIWFVFWRNKDGRKSHLALWLAASLGAWLVYRPWWAEIAGWVQRPLLRHWMFVPIRNLLGIETLSPLHFVLTALLVAGALAGAATVAPPILREPHRRRVITALVLMGFLAVVLLVPVPRIYAVKRVLATAWALVILFVAWLAVQVQQRRRVLIGLLLGVSLASSVMTAFFVPKDDWRGVARMVRQNAPDAVLWVDPRWNGVAYQYYDPEHQVLYGDLAKLEQVAAENEELWFVAERAHGRPIPSSPSETWLNENMELVKAIPFYRLELRQYQRRNR